MPKPLYAIMLDGGFLTKKLYQKLGRHAVPTDIIEVCDRLRELPYVADYELLRVYWYDAPPSSARVDKPVSGEPLDLATTERFRNSQSFYDQLILEPHLALRMGHVAISPNKWRLKPRVAKQLIKNPRELTDEDFDLDLSQKGVDIRVGLDMARLALRETVRTVIVVTGDSDFVPAFKFVRREGVKVILETMGHNVRPELKHHADIVI